MFRSCTRYVLAALGRNSRETGVLRVDFLFLGWQGHGMNIVRSQLPFGNSAAKDVSFVANDIEGVVRAGQGESVFLVLASVRRIMGQ